MIVKNIELETLYNYWIEVDHFGVKDKVIVDHISTLGPHITTFTDPKKISYGLYDNDYLIGVTQLVEWDETRIRYRTVNIRKEYRGKDLGWFLLKTAWKRDWTDNKYLFGWIKDTHYRWAVEHDFAEIDIRWQDNHTGMIRNMDDINGCY